MQAHLANADEIKLGWVSRVSPRDPNTNSIIAITKHPSAEFAHEVGIDVAKAWGTLKYLFDIFRKLDDGKFVILRDPNRVCPLT